MKALSMLQPWASLVAVGAKKIETRSWHTSYRGPVAIHASKGFSLDERYACYEKAFKNALLPFYPNMLAPDPGKPYRVYLPLGCVIATAEIACCYAMDSPWSHDGMADWVHELSAQEREFGGYDAGRYGWFLKDVVMLPEPIPAKGALGLWEWSAPA